VAASRGTRGFCHPSFSTPEPSTRHAIVRIITTPNGLAAIVPVVLSCLMGVRTTMGRNLAHFGSRGPFPAFPAGLTGVLMQLCSAPALALAIKFIIHPELVTCHPTPWNTINHAPW
jgi:hypothetical protein